MDDFLIHDNNKTGRSMHAIVIGVGDYPHLLGGSSQITRSHDGMRQLTSPPISARLVANWLIDDFNHSEYPHTTVSLLLSESTPKPFVNPVTNQSHDVQIASFSNIKEAIRLWKDRGDENIDDMLVFYFCGHGISEGNSIAILPSDFGNDHDNAYDTAIDFVGLYDAMAQYKARHQCFFVDACRSSSDTLKNNEGRRLLQVRPRSVEGVRVAPIYYSSLKGDAAHARTGKPSVFTDALVKCLSDFAAIDDEGDDDWRVSNFKLAEALEHIMKREEENGAELVQVPDSTEIRHKFYIHHLKSNPQARVYVHSDPPIMLSNAKLRFSNNGFDKERAPETGDEWSLIVPSGKYNIEATVEGEYLPRLTKEVRARPIFKKVTLDFT